MIKTGVALVLMLLAPLCALADSDTGSVSGFVRFLDVQTPHGFFDAKVGKTLAGVPITLEGPGGTWTVSTDARGYFIIFGIPPGSYEIYAERIGELWAVPGYADRYICVHAGENRSIGLFLDNGLHESLYAGWVFRHAYQQRFQPDASQTADMYSLGGC